MLIGSHGSPTGKTVAPWEAKAECPRCHFQWCKDCQFAWHGNATCQEAKRMRSLREDLERATQNLQGYLAQGRDRIITCPGCGAGIKKYDGCNHMSWVMTLVQLSRLPDLAWQIWWITVQHHLYVCRLPSWNFLVSKQAKQTPVFCFPDHLYSWSGSNAHGF